MYTHHTPPDGVGTKVVFTLFLRKLAHFIRLKFRPRGALKLNVSCRRLTRPLARMKSGRARGSSRRRRVSQVTWRAARLYVYRTFYA